MALKRILVHIDATARGKRALEAALDLAQSHDAHLIGCAVETQPIVPVFAAAQVPAEIYDSFAEEQRRMTEEAKKIFEEKCRAAGRSDRSEFVSGLGQPSRVISSFGRTTDLIIVGQAEPDTESVTIEELPDDLVLGAGRPVLIVPYIGIRRKMGENILVCWNDTREAARAISDALPFLKEAKSVSVFSINPSDGNDVPGAEIARYLAEHGVKAETNRTSAKDMEVGDLILNQVSESGADMVVMGAYGHSRLRETVLGGATRHILRHMTAPVMMSH